MGLDDRTRCARLPRLTGTMPGSCDRRATAGAVAVPFLPRPVLVLLARLARRRRFASREPLPGLS